MPGSNKGVGRDRAAAASEQACERSIFARRLAEARKVTGLSQRQLGLRAGLHPSVASPRVNQYEQGRHEPKLEMARQLATALGIPATFLYCDDELLAKLLLRWNRMTLARKREVVRLAVPRSGS